MSHFESRRAFLRQSLAALGGIGFTSIAGGWQAVQAMNLGLEPTVMRKSFGDYKALVCVFLFGGNDSLNMLVPRSDAEYSVYQQSRQNLAVAKDSLLAIVPDNSVEGQFGLHPSMTALKPLFDAGQLAFVTNVGPLIQPVTKEQYKNKSVALPPQLFSHNDQQSQWQTLRGKSGLKTGWTGRIADTWQQAGNLSMNISLSGSNLLQTGDKSLPYSLDTDGAQIYYNLTDSSWAREVARRTAFLKLLDGHDNHFEQAFGAIQKRSFALADIINSSLASAPTLNTSFPANNRLAAQLQMVAKMIAIRDELSTSRQVFFVSMGGFDTHDDQIPRQPVLYQQIAEAMSAFHQATVELGVSEKVTSFTASDFGRTLTSNGDGTDHGWGSHQLVLGGAVSGRRFYGQFPDLAIDGADDAGAGRLIPTTSVEQYSATLARWFGVDDTEMASIMPNLANFGIKDLGFLTA